jgi:hypothetical protein
VAKPGYRLKLENASEHLDALDSSIKGWLGSDAYRIVRERDPETRRTEIITRISGEMPDWSIQIGQVAHQIRSGLDHLALALNAKGYADANKGAALPVKARNVSEYPICGDMDADGNTGQGPTLFKKAKRRYRNMPLGAQGLIESKQPYGAGPDLFVQHPLWIVHELDRVDKHHEPLAVAAAVPEHVMLNFAATIDGGALGSGGPTYDGHVLSWWKTTKGTPEPNAEFYFTRDVALGQGTPIPGAPVVRTFRHVLQQIEVGIVVPLEALL